MSAGAFRISVEARTESVAVLFLERLDLHSQEIFLGARRPSWAARLLDLVVLLIVLVYEPGSISTRPG
jgi:hypothetical protein